MKATNHDSLEAAFDDSLKFSRRDFLKTASFLSLAATLSAGGLSSLTGCGYKSGWKPIMFPKILLYNFLLFDGIKNGLRKDLFLLIENGEIKALENAGDISGFENFKKVDLKGYTLLPGLIDNHVHVTVPFMYNVNLNFIVQIDQQIVNNLKYCVMKGVTTVRDVGAIPGKLIKFRSLCEENNIPGPRIISSLSPIAARRGKILGAPEKSPYITNPAVLWLIGGNYAERPQNLQEIREACERMIRLGAQWLKTLYQEHPYSYVKRGLPNHTDEGYRLILEIGKKHGIKCAFHQVNVNGFKKGVEFGYHTLDHIPIDGIIPDIEIENFISKEISIMPTITAFGDDLDLERLLGLIESKGREFLAPEAIKQMSKLIKDLLSQSKNKLAEDEKRPVRFERQYGIDMFPNAIKNLQKLYKMGANVGVGTDSGGTPTGFFGRFNDELRHYSKAGIPNFDILRMATEVNAKIIDMHNKIGTIEKGKLADIIAVEGNPLNDINALDNVKMVMKGGILMNAAKSIGATT